MERGYKDYSVQLMKGSEIVSFGVFFINVGCHLIFF